MVEIEEATATGEERFDMAEVYEVYLCADRTATNTIGIHSMATPSARIAHQCRSQIENPTNRERFAPVNESFIPILELIISCVYRVRESVTISKCTSVPKGVFAVGVFLLFLCERRGQKEDANKNRAEHTGYRVEQPNSSSSVAATAPSH